MAKATYGSAATPVSVAAFPTDLWTTFTSTILDVQRAQWGALLDWQRSLVAFNKDFWEQWASRYAGGVPIDG